jgi:hypothetical protein
VLGVIGMWEPGEPRGPEFEAWVRAGWERCGPFCTGGVQTAGADPRELRGQLRALLAVKRSYDPANLFRSNRKVR